MSERLAEESPITSTVLVEDVSGVMVGGRTPFGSSPAALASRSATTWSLSTLQRSLRQAEDGLPEVSTYTIWLVLQSNGFSWQKDGSWCETGKVLRKRKAGIVEVVDPDAIPKKS